MPAQQHCTALVRAALVNFLSVVTCAGNHCKWQKVPLQLLCVRDRANDAALSDKRMAAPISVIMKLLQVETMRL